MELRRSEITTDTRYVVQQNVGRFNAYNASYWEDIIIYSTPFAAIEDLMELRKEQPGLNVRVVVRYDTPMIIPETDIKLIHDGD